MKQCKVNLIDQHKWANSVLCGDKATGFNNRALTCEDYKGYFKRMVQEKLTYTRKFNSECDISG